MWRIFVVDGDVKCRKLRRAFERAVHETGARKLDATSRLRARCLRQAVAGPRSWRTETGSAIIQEARLRCWTSGHQS
jgi:hypothetical protein